MNAGPMMGQGIRAGAMMSMGHGLAHLSKGLMPGEHLIPAQLIHEAAHAYKTGNRLHGDGFHASILPAHHVIHLMNQHVENPHGGFLPLIAAAALPWLGSALGALGTGAAGAAGAYGVNKILGNGFPNLHGLIPGNLPGLIPGPWGQIAQRVLGHGIHLGLPMPVHHAGHTYYKIHGEGFKDILKKALGFIGRAIKSNPARKAAGHLAGALNEGLQSAIAERMDQLEGKLPDSLKHIGHIANQVAQDNIGRVMDTANDRFQGRIGAKRRIGPKKPVPIAQDQDLLADLKAARKARDIEGSGMKRRRMTRTHTRNRMPPDLY